MKRTYENYNPHKMYVCKEEKPDKLLASAFVTITAEQEDFLNLYMDEPRNTLYKSFRKRFNSNINKLQFNFVLEKVKENVVKPEPHKRQVTHRYPIPNVEKARNVYWVTKQGVWIVKFKKKGKSDRLGTFTDHEKAKKVAEEYRKQTA